MPPESKPSIIFETEHLQADLRGRTVRGGLLTLTSQGTTFVLQTISTVVLARLLTPADFGLVAMVTAITALAIAFADFGLSEATIQRKEISHGQVSTLFWINVAIGVGLMLLTAALAPVLAWFYGEPRLRNITLVLSLTFLISGLRVQHDAILKRQMRFQAIAARNVFSYVITVPAAIAMAMRGAGYWAIVAIPLGLGAIQMMLSWLLVSWRPGLPRRDPAIGPMLAFGGNVAASYIINYVHRNADNVLIGWYWGAGPLGLYSRAYNLLMAPLRQLNAPATAVAVSAFSRLQDQPELYARYYLRAASLIMWIVAPLFGFLAVAAEPVIVLLLGSQWRESATVFRILAISALGQPLMESASWLFISRGQSSRLFKLGLATAPVIVGSFVVGLRFGIKGVALSYAVTLLVILPWIMNFTFRGTELTLQRLGRAVLYPVLLWIAGILVSSLALRIFAPESELLKLLVVALSFVAAYLLAALIPPIRNEALSFGSLLNELRPARQGSQAIPVEAFNGIAQAAGQSPLAAVPASHASVAAAGRVQPKLVSILIPAYNAEKWIAETISSAVGQTWPHKEVIVVDDGSRDATLAVAKAFAPRQVRVVSQPNQGVCAARNHALRLAHGDYIQWLDADDLLAPDKIERQVEALHEGDSKRILLSSPWGSFLHRHWRAEFSPNSLWHDLSPVEWLLRKMSENLHMQTATWLTSRELTEAAGPWDTRLLVDNDGEYFCRVLLASEGTRFVSGANVLYRDTPTGRVSFIGVSEKKKDSKLLAMRLHIQYLRSLEDSERVRKACLSYMQDWFYFFYPERPDLVAEMQELAAQLGGHLEEPRLRRKYAWIQPLFGWQAAKRAQMFAPQLKVSLVRQWDKAMYRLESRPKGR